VIATPAAAAQDVCDRLVAAGVTSILNFAPVVLSVPSGVDVRKVDLSIELQILAFHAQRRAVVRVPADTDRSWGASPGRRRNGIGPVRPGPVTAAIDDGGGPGAQAVAT
jgi:redox-sensing transcriptional repressor